MHVSVAAIPTGRKYRSEIYGMWSLFGITLPPLKGKSKRKNKQNFRLMLLNMKHMNPQKDTFWLFVHPENFH